MINFIHKIFRLRGITSRFLFWVVLLVFLTCALYLVTYSAIDRTKRIEETQEDLHYVVKNQKKIVENWVENRFQEARLFANFLVDGKADLEVIANRFAYYHDFYNQFNSIVHVDEQGFVKIDTGTEQVLITENKINLSNREYFQKAKEGHESIHIVGSKYPTGDQAVIFTAPVFDQDNAFKGLVFTAINLEEINELLMESIKGKTGKTLIFNVDGQVISALYKNIPKNESKIPTEISFDLSVLNNAPSDGPKYVQYKNGDGTRTFAVFTPILNGEIYLMSEIDEKEVLEQHNNMVKIMFAITIAIYIAAIIIILPVSRGLLRPFFYIVAGINRMKEGRYNTRLNEEKFKSSPIELRQMMQGFNEMARSIKDNKNLLQRMTQTDGLTGIANRRFYEDKLNEEWENALQLKQPISLLFIDIDHFKKYNDSFGHLQGDICLKKIAAKIDQTTYAFDRNYLAARYGGEEFVAILPNTTEEEAMKVAEEIHNQIKKLEIVSSENVPSQFVTTSTGIATIIPTEEIEKETFVKKADAALYVAKSRGRNTIVLASSLVDEKEKIH